MSLSFDIGPQGPMRLATGVAGDADGIPVRVSPGSALRRARQRVGIAAALGVLLLPLAMTAASGAGPVALATGGTITNYTEGGTTYAVHTFDVVGEHAFTPTQALTVDYLVVGGGGGGGAWVGGGGGGGGALVGTTLLTGPVTVTVGAGGEGAFFSEPVNEGTPEPLPRTINATVATSGSPSSLGPSITASGGGHGATYNWQVPGAAGTGGGASHSDPSSVSPAGQGFPGGTARVNDSSNGYPTGGGGGAGGPGQDATATRSGDGGIGLASSITGVEIRYGGGGGGGIHPVPAGSTAAAPGEGRDGGGDGAAVNTVRLPTQNGEDGRGGGGGGGGNLSTSESFGGHGGSGVVIIRYALPEDTGDTTGDSDDGGAAAPVLDRGSVPSLAAGVAVLRAADGTATPLAVTSSAANRLRYSTDGLTVTFTGAPGTSVATGLVVDANGEVVCEVCVPLAAGQVIEVWMFSSPRLVAAHLVDGEPCQTFSIPVVAPLDGGGPVGAGGHTLQLSLPTSSGMQAVNVGVTVGGPLPASVPAGEGRVPSGAALFLLLGSAGALLVGRRLVMAG